jgi:flavin-dependent dehydrogenase
MTGAATDLLVIGGGPAGLATAIQARLAGLSVRVLDRCRPPIDKACGEGLMPDAVARLGELGVALPPGEGCRIRGIRYLDGDTVAEGVFPRAGGLGVRRLDLHRALVRRAEELGVELCWGVAATGLAPAQPAPARPSGEPAPVAQPGTPAPRLAEEPGRWLASGAYTDRAGLELAAARWVVGADGLRSRVRQWAGLEPSSPPDRSRRFGVRRHFACRPWSDMVEVYWGPGCEAYVTPVGPRLVGVAMLWGGPERSAVADGQADVADEQAGALAAPTAFASGAARALASFDHLLASFPALAARLAGAPPASRDRGAGPLLQRARAVVRGNVALVGDAAGYVDAITGEGLAVALHQAVALVAALAPATRAAGNQPAAPEVTTLHAKLPYAGALEAIALNATAPGRPAASDDQALARYAAAQRRIGRLPDNMTSLLLAIERRPRLRRRVVRALAAEPALFSRLLGIHARALPPARLGIDGALRLVYRLVTV